jgi:hypothetical protein
MTPPEALQIIIGTLAEYLDEYETDNKIVIGKPVVNTVPITIDNTDFLLTLKKVAR